MKKTKTIISKNCLSTGFIQIIVDEWSDEMKQSFQQYFKDLNNLKFEYCGYPKNLLTISYNESKPLTPTNIKNCNEAKNWLVNKFKADEFIYDPIIVKVWQSKLCVGC